MPQMGYTETALWEDMHPLYALAKADDLAIEAGLPNLLVLLTKFCEDRPRERCFALGPRAGPGMYLATNRHSIF
jgi:hypothetical protein